MRDRARPARRPLPRRGRGRAAGSSAAASSVFDGMPWALYLPRDTAYRVERRRRGRDLRRALRAPARARARPAGGRRDRGARRGQRDAADQPHRQAGVPGRAAARRRGVHARRATGRATRRTSTTRTTRRGEVVLEETYYFRTASRGAFAVQRLYSPRHGARPDGDGARRRPDARPVRLPHDRRRARLRPLLPERARRRPALDGLRRRSRPGLDPRRVGGLEPDPRVPLVR